MDFYNNNGPTTFITNICAFLGIDTGRLKIVGIRTGSTIVDFVIQDSATPLDSANSTLSNPSTIAAQFNALSASLTSGLTQGAVNVGAPVISVSSQVVIINTDGTVYTV